MTGQAAWFDLRVSVRKLSAEEATQAQADDMELLGAIPGAPDTPDKMQYGKDFGYNPAGKPGESEEWIANRDDNVKGKK